MNNAIEKIIEMTLDGRLRWKYSYILGQASYWTYHNNTEIYITPIELAVGRCKIYPTNTDLHMKLYRLVSDYDSEENDIIFEDDVTAVVAVMGW